MKQQTLSDMEYSNRKKRTKREEFLEIMEDIIPWDKWTNIVEPVYPTGKRGRPPVAIETILRMYLLQVWFNLSDEGTEDAIYDSYAMRKFMGLNFMQEGVPDATTLLKFRRILENSDQGKAMFEGIVKGMKNAGQIMRGESIVDATIINARPRPRMKRKNAIPK